MERFERSKRRSFLQQLNCAFYDLLARAEVLHAGGVKTGQNDYQKDLYRCYPHRSRQEPICGVTKSMPNAQFTQTQTSAVLVSPVARRFGAFGRERLALSFVPRLRLLASTAFPPFQSPSNGLPFSAMFGACASFLRLRRTFDRICRIGF